LAVSSSEEEELEDERALIVGEAGSEGLVGGSGGGEMIGGVDLRDGGKEERNERWR
jgi:hypothetical protein